MHKVPQKVVEIAQEVKEGQPSRRYRVRAVLKWFGAERRGSHIVSEIQKTLKGFGVCTEPALDKAGIEDQVRFVRLPSTTEVEPESELTDSQSPESPESPDSAPLEAVDNHVADENSIGSSALITVSEDQLEPENGDEQPIVKPDDRPVTSQSSDWTISALRDKLDRGQLDLQPRFQREYVWSLRPELPSRLIEFVAAGNPHSSHLLRKGC